MKATLSKLLGVRELEVGRVMYLLSLGFFTGIFLATFEVSSYALFITHFSEKADLPIAIVLSGFLGMVFTYIYSRLQTKIKYKHLIFGILTFMIVVIGGLAYGFVNFEYLNNLFYVAFVLMVPFSYLLMLIFWGIFGRVFNVGEAKRIIGNIDLGQMLATLFAFFAIAFVTHKNFYFDYALIKTENLIYFSLLALVGCIVTFSFVTRNYQFNQSEIENTGKNKEITIAQLFKNKYLFLLSCFIVLSMIASTFIDYSFANIITTRYNDEESLASFISLFQATIIIFGFLLQTVITDRVIQMYGLKVALIINPILVLAIMGMAIFAGLFFGFLPEDNYFVFFFIAIAGSKLFISSIKDAVDSPTFKLYFLPIPINLRLDAQSKIEGVVNATSYSIGGILIILISKFDAFNLLYISISVMPILVLWYLIINRMYSKYQDTLQFALRSGVKKEKQHSEHFTIDSILVQEMKGGSEEQILYGLKLMERLEPTLFESMLLKFSKNKSEKVAGYVAEKLESVDLEYNAVSDTKSLAAAALKDNINNEFLSIPPDRLLRLSKSVKVQDRMLAAKFLRKLINDDNIFILLELLRDMDSRVKREAIITARIVKRQETFPLMVDFLSSSYFCQYASDALIAGGVRTLDVLETSFHKSGQTDEVMRKIVQVMGRIGGKKAIKLMWKKIDFPDRKVVRQILISLRHYNYQAKGYEKTNIKSILEHEAGKTIWNLVAIKELPAEPVYEEVRNALKEEVHENFEDIFMLLSILYDPAAVQLVKHNIEKGSAEGITYGLELLALFIETELREMLFPLMDDISIAEKQKQLQDQFPREHYNPYEVLTFILARNYNLLNRWTKAAAIFTIAYLEDYPVNDELVAQLFNPDNVLRETAGWVIYNRDKDKYESVTKRLLPEEKRKLDDSMEKNKLIDGLDDGYFLNIEMCQRLKQLSLFNEFPGFMITEIIDKTEILYIKEGQSYYFDRMEDASPIIILAFGTATMDHSGEMFELESGDVVGDIVYEDKGNVFDKIIAKENAVLFKITNHDFYNVMANRHRMAQLFLASVKRNFEKLNQNF